MNPASRPHEDLLSEAIGKWDSPRVADMAILFKQCEEAARAYNSPGACVEAIKMFIQFLQIGLGPHHWRNIQVRNFYIEAAHSISDGIPKAAKDLSKVLEQQLASEAIFFPRLHWERITVRFDNSDLFVHFVIYFDQWLNLANDLAPEIFNKHREWQKDLSDLVDIDTKCKMPI